jgi:hypothetical protein
MTALAFFQALFEFSENYLGRSLQPEERVKLQNFCNQEILRQNARQASTWHKQEIQKRVHKTLMQLLSRVRRELQEDSGHPVEKDQDITPAPAENVPAENAAAENAPES